MWFKLKGLIAKYWQGLFYLTKHPVVCLTSNSTMTSLTLSFSKRLKERGFFGVKKKKELILRIWMIQCLCKRKSLQAMHNLTWPADTTSPVSIYQMQNSPRVWDDCSYSVVPKPTCQGSCKGWCQSTAPSSHYLLWLAQQKAALRRMCK